jgi:uncharacterized membrane protein
MKRLHQERGAVAVLTAASMLMVMAAVALSVDIGDMVWRQRQVQGVVDMASLDAVRALSDRRDASARCTQALNYARQSAGRNNFDYSLAGYSLDVYLGTVDSTRKWTQLGSNSCNADPTFDPSTANAVKVTASRPVLFRFMPGSNGVLASGISSSAGEGDIGMGTWAARVNTSYLTSFDKMMYCMGKGGAVCSASSGLTVAGYSGLASASIGLGSLFTSLNIGSASDIANTSVGYQSFLLAAATIMTSQGNAATATALNTLAASADSFLTFKFGDFINATSGYGSAAAASMNVAELVTAAAEVANNQHFVEVDGLGVAVPGVASVNMKMAVIEPPQWSYGPVGTTVHTAQVRTEFDLNLASGLNVCLLLACVNVPLTLKVYAESAAGDGTITAISCGATSTANTETIHATTSAVSLYVGQVSPNSAFTNVSVTPTVSPATLADVSILGGIHVVITAANSINLVGANTNVTMGPGTYPRSTTVVANSLNSDSLTTGLNVGITALGLSISTASVLALINPVIQSLDTSLFTALATLPVGIQLAGADLWNTVINCSDRKLVG